ncbi:MAG TPA: PaaI family thioesterase [Thermomicrobiales bacterium]|jgi:uncharacterized protein (TIGR00369 family)
MTTKAERTRTFAWDDPTTGLSAARTLSGLEYLRAMQRRELPGPPIAATLDFTIAEIDEGRVVFAVIPAEFHYNPIGAVHGGLAATLCDSAMGCAVHSTLPAGTAYTTIELKVNYIRALTKETGLVRCEGKTIVVGGRIATAEARMTDAAGTLYAHATTTCLIMRPQRRERS